MKKKKINIKLCTLFGISFLAICVVYLYKTSGYSSVGTYLTNSIERNDITYNEAQKMIKEAMKAYYIKGEKMQYNNAKATYGEESPENATSQNILYVVCGAYATNVYQEAFGMKKSNSYFPIYNPRVISEARSYYKSNIYNKTDIVSADNGHFLIYYQNTVKADGIEPSRYIYSKSDSNVSVSEFAKLIKPGDIFTYTGHVLVAYDIAINPSTGKLDVLILNSVQSPYINTRIKSTNKLSNSFFKSATKNNIIDIDKQGSIKYTWLSLETNFVKNDTINCQNDECVVIRPFYESDKTNEKGEKLVVFNYNIDEYEVKKSKLRIEYPGLDIDKTVSAGSGNSVYLNNELTYSIKITNKSNVSTSDTVFISETGEVITSDGNSDAKKYSRFCVEEKLDDKVEFVSATNNGKLDGNKIVWSISELDVGKSIVLTYTVRIKNDFSSINKEIESSGRFYKDSNVDISLAIIKNKIIPTITLKLNEELNNYSGNSQYEKCYNKITSNTLYRGLNLVNEVTKCATDIDLNLVDTEGNNNFRFSDLIERKSLYYTENGKEKLRAKTTSNAIYLSDSNSKYKEIILNNYWSGTFYYVDSNQVNLGLPWWTGDKTKIRAETVNSVDFKDGDILIYQIDNTCTSNNIERYPQKTSSETNPNLNTSKCNDVYTGKFTKEHGLYAYIYINNEFIGLNGERQSDVSIGTERNNFSFEYYNEFTNKFYTKNSTGGWDSTATNSLYGAYDGGGYGKLCNLVGGIMIYGEKTEDKGNRGYSKTAYCDLSGDNVDINKYNEIMTFNNYQTLFEKDYYVILRPELGMKWYGIKYNANGGSGSMNNQSMTYNTPKELLQNIFIRTGYTFNGWNTQSDGKGTSYKDKASVSNLTSKSGEVVNLYAIWEKASLDIQSEKYSLNLDKKIIDKIPEKTLVSEFNKQITLREEYTISTESKKVDKNEYIYTGSKTKIYKNGTLYDEFTNIVLGDTTGDGIVNISDVSKLYRFLKNKIVMDGIYVYAGNVVSTDDKIGINDVSKLYRYLRGKIDSLR